jgi:hypothetical protein
MNANEQNKLLLEIVLDVDKKLRNPSPMFWDYHQLVEEVLKLEPGIAKTMTVGQVINGFLKVCENLSKDAKIYHMEAMSCDASKLLEIENFKIYG